MPIKLSNNPKLETPLFVYGTLMRDRHNSWLMAELEAGGHAELRTEGAQAINKIVVDMGGLPAIYDIDDPIRTLGEFWRISAEGLQVLDNFEGHPDFYQRMPISIMADGAVLMAYTYLGPPVDDGGTRRAPSGKCYVRGSDNWGLVSEYNPDTPASIDYWPHKGRRGAVYARVPWDQELENEIFPVDDEVDVEVALW